MDTKRIIISTLSGLLFGIVCYGLAAGGGHVLPKPIAWQIIANRTLIGFAIGISVLRMNWALHGVLLGFLFSLPMAYSGMVADVPGFSKSQMFIATVVMGMIYGLLIEVITTVIFKAKKK